MTLWKSRFAGYYIRGIIDYALQRFARDHSIKEQVSIAKELSDVVIIGYANIIMATAFIDKGKKRRTDTVIKICEEYIYWQTQHILVLHHEILMRYAMKPSELRRIGAACRWPWQCRWNTDGTTKATLADFTDFTLMPSSSCENTEALSVEGEADKRLNIAEDGSVTTDE